MKNPLNYQVLENDAGGTSLLNCLSYLFEREEMPLELVKIINSYAASCYDAAGNIAANEFSNQFMYYIASWVKAYAKEKQIPLRAIYLHGDNVDLLKIRKCLMAGGCVQFKAYKQTKHYVCITKMDEDEIFIFDPYYRENGYYRQAAAITVVDSEPFEFNRRVRLSHFVSENKAELVLGPENEREAILFIRDDAMLQREFD